MAQAKKNAAEIQKLLNLGMSRDNIKKDRPDLADGWKVIDEAVKDGGTKAASTGSARGSGSVMPGRGESLFLN